MDLSALKQRLHAPVDSAGLAAFRIGFGALIFGSTLRDLVTGKVTAFYIGRPFLFKYYGFGWVDPWSGDGMLWHYALLAATGMGIMLGAAYRFCIVVFTLCYTYVFLLDQARYLNHHYLLCLVGFLLCWLPAESSWSLDNRWRRGSSSPTNPAWCVWVLRAQIGIVYFYAGVSKLNSDWLGGEPLRRWLGLKADLPVVGPWLAEPWAAEVAAYCGLMLDLFITPLLLWHRSRWMAALALLMFHCSNSLLFHIDIFPWFMLWATLLFFRQDWPRLVLRRVATAVGKVGAVHHRGPVGRRGKSRRLKSALSPRVAPAILAAYFAIQILVPLRHHLYSGDVAWTEEGHRFAWRMKLREKNGWVVFQAFEPRSGRSGSVDPKRYLDDFQFRVMATRPDMLLQISRHMAAQLAELEGRPPEIHIESMLSLNARPPQMFVDPEVDVAAQPRTLGHTPWIVPLRERPLDP